MLKPHPILSHTKELPTNPCPGETPRLKSRLQLLYSAARGQERMIPGTELGRLLAWENRSREGGKKQALGRKVYLKLKTSLGAYELSGTKSGEWLRKQGEETMRDKFMFRRTEEGRKAKVTT